MRNLQEIIDDLKHNLYWSQPNIRFIELTNLINELESTLNHTEETTTVEEPIIEELIIEEPIVEEILETTSTEPILIEETVVEKITTPKKSRKSK